MTVQSARRRTHLPGAVTWYDIAVPSPFRGNVFLTGTFNCSHANFRGTMDEEMADVSHTPPEGDSLGHIWERGPDDEE